MIGATGDAIPFGPGAFCFIGIYLLSLIGLGILGKKAQKENSMQDFYLGGKGIGFLVLWFTMFATQYSGNTIIGFTGKAYQVGFAWMTSVHFMTAIVVGYLLFAPQLHRLSKREGFITPSDFLTFRYQHRGLSLLATLIMVSALANFFLAQLTAMGRAVEGLTSIDPSIAFAWGVIILAGIMLLYETLGGFRAVAWTDLIQGGILAVGFGLLLILIFFTFGSPTDTTEKILAQAPEKALPPKGVQLRQWISYIFLLGIGAALYPQAIQRIYAAENSGSLRKGLAAMAFMPLCSALVATIVGITVLAHLPGNMIDQPADTALTVMLREIQSQSWLGYALVVVIFTAILGAIMSTGDSALLSISSMLTKDIYAGFISPSASQTTLTRLGKIISALLVALLATAAIGLNQLEGKVTLVQLLNAKFDLLIQLAPAFMLGINWKGLRAGPTFLGMLLGLVFALSFFWIPKEGAGLLSVLKTSGFHAGLWGLLLNLLIAIIGSLVLNRRAHTIAA